MSPESKAENLFQLARDKSVQGRTALAKVISDLFDNQEKVLTDREKRLMFNILHNLIHEIEASVRAKLSEKMATLIDAPHDLVVQLANDEFDVAYPILTKSKVLRDMDLIDVIRLRTNEYHLAITLRDDVSEEVSGALVEIGDETIIESLLNNQNAKISISTMEYLVEQSKRVDTFQEPLLHRHDLKEDLAKRMFMWVSAALRNHIVDRYEIDSVTVDALLDQAAHEELDKTLLDHRESKSRTKQLAGTLKTDGAVTPEMLVQALKDGEAALFLSLLSELTQLSDILTKRIVFEEGGEGMAIACKAVGISELHFAVIFRKSRGANPELLRTLNQDINKVLDLFRSMDPNAAKKVLSMWQRGSDYLSALREIDLDG